MTVGVEEDEGVGGERTGGESTPGTADEKPSRERRCGASRNARDTRRTSLSYSMPCASHHSWNVWSAFCPSARDMATEVGRGGAGSDGGARARRNTKTSLPKSRLNARLPRCVDFARQPDCLPTETNSGLT